jgi:hypothetical protein
MNKRLRELLRLKEQIRESEEMIEEFDVYSEQGINCLVDSDGMSPAEQGFMQGYLEV